MRTTGGVHEQEIIGEAFWSAKRKQEVVLRLLRGESLDALSRETGQPASVLSQWRDEFLEGGLAALKRRTDDPKVAALEQELKRSVKRMVGDLMMDKCRLTRAEAA